jgi:cytochrome c oxidase subunit 1
MIFTDAIELKRQRKLAIIWGVTFLILFPFLVTLGLLMRLDQGNLTTLSPTTFYALMTLHGLGMAGVLFSFAFSALWYLNGTRYVKLSAGIGYFVYFAILVGVSGLTIGTLIGKFGPGWYMLYPLPFTGATWSHWSIGVSVISLIILGLAWLTGILHLLYTLAKEYGGFTHILGWQYLRKKENKRDLPPIVMITTISLVPGVFGFLVAAAMLIMYLLQFFEPTLNFDPLLLKNMVMFFGHLIVNITLYCCVGWVYALLPEFTGREWKTDKVLVYSWNATFFFILFAYFHHLYMDFAQPRSLQYLGQIISYASAIPATAITMFGVIAQLYHSKIKWDIIPLMFLFGMAGWAIGGFSAVVDSTIAVNKVFHNTLWVPGHFHTYLLMGVVLFIFGFLFYLFSEKGNRHGSGVAKTGFWVFITGGYGFVLMFYYGGVNSIPRRYSSYAGISINSTATTGVHLAQIAVLFIILVLTGLLIMYISLFTKLFRRKEIQ